MKRLLAAPLLLLAANGTAAAQDRRVVFEETLLVCSVQKPEITILITRQNLSAGYEVRLRESFVPRIAQSVEKGPF